MATSNVNYKYFDSKSSEAFGGSWAQIFNRTLHQPMDLSQVQPFLTYFEHDLNDRGSTANMYKGQIVVLTSDDASSNTSTYSAYSPFDDKTGRTGPYLIYGYNSGTGSTDGTYFADRILTYTEQQAHYVRKYDIGAYYTGVGEWWQITRSTYANDKELARIYRDSVETFTDKQATKFSYGEIFNDYEYNLAFGSYSHAEGYHTKALAYGAHSEGKLTIAFGSYSHAEGYNTTAYGNYSHTEGYQTTASNIAAHTEGYNNKAVKIASHAEGCQTIAYGLYSHSQGYATYAKNENSFAGGLRSYTNANNSIAHGTYIITGCANEAAFGLYNGKNGSTTYTDRIFEIGVGRGDTDRKNALEITSSGNTNIINNLAVGNGINITNGGLTVKGNLNIQFTNVKNSNATSVTITNSKNVDVITNVELKTTGELTYQYTTINTTHTGSLTGSTAANQTIGSTSSTTATFVTAGSLSADGVLSGTTGTISHATSGVTAGNYGPSANATPGFSGKFSVPYITVNDCGHITTASTKTITIPSQSHHSGSLTGSTATNQTIGSTSSTKATFVTAGSLSATGVLSGTTGTISHATSGVTAGNYGPSKDKSPGSAGTFSVPYITVNDCGHITTASTKTITMPGVGNATISFYLSNDSNNGTTSSGSFTTNQSSDGSVYLNNVARTNSTNTFTGNQTAPAWYVSSDINYKEIIDDCKITIDEIANLPIFDYIWKLDKEKKTHTGSSAQSVESILPNLVTEDDKGIKSLDYASLGTIAGVIACREICKLRDKLDKIEKLISNK